MNLETEFRICWQLMRLACLQSEPLLCDRPLTEAQPWDITWDTEADWESTLESDLETEVDSEPGWGDSSRSHPPAWGQPDLLSAPFSIPAHAPLTALPPSSWVQLVQPSPLFGGQEALLLCQIASCQWLAWMPEYGELILGREEFYWDCDPD